MFHPVGSQPPSVYWRRRLILLGSIGLLLVLMILTVKIATSDGSEPTGAGGHSTPPVHTTPVTHTSTSTSVSNTHHASAPASTSSSTSTKSSSAAPQPC